MLSIDETLSDGLSHYKKSIHPPSPGMGLFERKLLLKHNCDLQKIIIYRAQNK